MANLGARLRKLETAAIGGGVLVVKQRPGESEEEAWARLWAEHPAQKDNPGITAVLLRHFGFE